MRLFLIGLVFIAYCTTQFNVSIVAENYQEFKPRSLTIGDHGLALVLLAIPVLILPLGNVAIAAAGWVLYSFTYFSAAVAGICLFSKKSEYIAFMTMIAFGGLVSMLVAKVRIPDFPCTWRKINLDLSLLLASGALAVFAWSLSDFNFTLDLDNLKIYSRRLAARENNIYIGYLIAPLRLVIPVLAVYAWRARKNYWWLAVAAISSVALFSYEGVKTALILPFFLWLILVSLQKNRLPQVLLLGIVILNLFAQGEYQIAGSSRLLDSAVRRTLLVPGMMATFYWTYAPFVENLNNITFQVGKIFFDDEKCNANTNYLIWGWIWGRWGGVAIVAFMAGLIISIFNAYPRKNFPCLGALMAAGCMFFWSEQFLHTSLLSSSISLLAVIAIIIGLAPNGFSKIRPNTTKIMRNL